MNVNCLNLFLTAIIMVVAIPTNASDFAVDGLYYNILSEEDRTVEVTYYDEYAGNKDYVNGYLDIPKKIIYSSKRLP